MGAVVGVINYNGRVLIEKKRSDSKTFLAGKWHIPGGKRNKGENPTNALMREMKEETGLDVIIGNYLGHFFLSPKSVVRLYECFSETDSAIPGSDLEELKWVPRKSVPYEVDPEASDLWPNEILNYFLH